MTNAKLASELRAIGRELDEILAGERAAATDLEAMETLLWSIGEAKAAGLWRNTRI